MAGSSRDRRAASERRCEHLVARSALLCTGDLAWERIGDHEVDAATLDCLVYMRDVEGFTDRDLVGLAGHPTTLADPLISRFLVAWRAEEAAHSAALDRFLRSYADQRGIVLPTRELPPPADVAWAERALVRASRPLGHVVAAAHMAWGAANELLTLNGYRLLAGRTSHPVLAALLTRIADQEARHYSFYRLQAEWRLAASPLARRLLHRVLTRSWTPVGIGEGYKAPEEFDRVLHHLSAGPGGDRVLARMDAAFARLPGFGDLTIFRDASVASRSRSTAAADDPVAPPVAALAA